jgi:hypothetical protein
VCISLEEDETESGLGLPARSLVMSVPELAIVLGWDRAPVEAQEEEQLDGAVNADVTESTTDAKETNGVTCNKKKHPIFCLEKLLQVGIILLMLIACF